MDGYSIFLAIKNWFNDLGWFANALAIGALFSPLFIALRKRARASTAVSTFSALAQSQLAATWNDGAMKRIGEVAIVDDDPEDFPVEELRRDGFHVKVYKQVRLSDITTLAKYDVVLLDMHGIVADDIEQGGLKLIARLREQNPRQKICAVSSKSFDPTATNFFRQADDVRKKPMNSHTSSEVILQLMREKLDPVHLAKELDALTVGLPTAKRQELIRVLTAHAKQPDPTKELNLPQDLLPSVAQSIMNEARDFSRLLRHASH